MGVWGESATPCVKHTPLPRAPFFKSIAHYCSVVLPAAMPTNGGPADAWRLLGFVRPQALPSDALRHCPNQCGQIAIPANADYC